VGHHHRHCFLPRIPEAAARSKRARSIGCGSLDPTAPGYPDCSTGIARPTACRRAKALGRAFEGRNILVSGVLLAEARPAADVTRSLAIRLFGEQGSEYQRLVGATIHSVTFGVLGVALIQTAFAAAGLIVVGLPGASVWSVIFLFAAILQVGVVVPVPAVVYAFAIAATTKALIFLLWCIIVGLMDNVLKPPCFQGGAQPFPSSWSSSA